jgi:UDP-3-O-[3-hydroxymyristoyl] glucosamine N-acyltransferase
VATAAQISPGAFVDAEAQLASGVVVRAGTVIHGGARIGAGSRIGSGTVIHPGVELAERCTVEDLVVLGKRPRLRAGSSAARDEDPGSLILEEGVTVC